VLPWDLNPVLQQTRLVTLAKVAVATRNKAFAEADRDAGDTAWGLACKAHERLMHALERLAVEHPWLTVVREGLYVMPHVEDVPIRLYRGAPDRPGSRHLEALRLEHERSQAERSQMAFDFMGGPGDGGPWYWLMAMETGADGMVSRVVFVQANDAGETRHPWECPMDELRDETTPARPALQLVGASITVAPAHPETPKPPPQAPQGRPRRGAKVSPVPPANRQEDLWGAAI
jgi:hypothetical protein